MMVEIVRIPKLGLSDYADLVSWEIKIGESVSEEQVLAVLESEKASAEIESPTEGVLLETYVEEGEEIAIDVGKPLAVVGEEGEEVPAPEEIEDGDEGVSQENDSESDLTEGDQKSSPPSEIKATPRAKRRAGEEDNIDLHAIEGTGPQGAITEEDIEQHLEERTEEIETAGAPDSTNELTVTESRELSGTRKTIAERLSRSAREKPHVMGTREVSIEQLEHIREHLDDRYDIDVSMNDLLLYLVGRVLQDLPEFNAHFEDGMHKLIDEVNLGYAVDGQQGLVVPVIEQAGDRSLPELAERRQTLVGRVLNDDHSVEDLQGGTFTVTNVGVFDMDVSYSIINPPEVAILAIGRRKYAPVERDGDIEFENVITFSLTIDHRVLDGADSGAFLDQLAEYAEYPGAMLDAI
jgi:pyruvate dehydrogenase E2 component (dihydrolipoamide acetyltransferase)